MPTCCASVVSAPSCACRRHRTRCAALVANGSHGRARPRPRRRWSRISRLSSTSLRGTSLVRAEESRAAERGSALVLALMATLVMTTLGSALVLLALTETRIVQVTSAGVEALYGAGAALERAVLDLS